MVRKLGGLAVLLLAPIMARAEEPARFGDWMVDTATFGMMAATVNDSGSTLAHLCYDDSGDCIWVIASPVKCEKGDAFPALINAPSGVEQAGLTCLIEGRGQYFLGFNDFQQVSKLADQGARIGIAIALVEGNFKVMRFSMKGAKDASNVASAVVDATHAERTTDLDL